jgi:hypothetical protein
MVALGAAGAISSARQAPKWAAVWTTRIDNGIAAAYSYAGVSNHLTLATGADIDARQRLQ